MFAALGSAVASGHELAVQLAVSLPAVLVAGPVAVGRAAECAADAAVAAVIGESAEWEDIVAAWCEGFMDDAREEAFHVLKHIELPLCTLELTLELFND